MCASISVLPFGHGQFGVRDRVSVTLGAVLVLDGVHVAERVRHVGEALVDTLSGLPGLPAG